MKLAALARADHCLPFIDQQQQKTSSTVLEIATLSNYAADAAPLRGPEEVETKKINENETSCPVNKSPQGC